MAKKLIVNCATGEQSIVDLTDEEETARVTAQTEAEAQREADEATEAKRVADKASGDAKLKELGLTDDEIAAR
tara:strand:- start:127 stop:345 length:219 start_codon:yes stop_codon:yes gene_type:complete